ncbi:MAG: hypothetical protein LBV08_06560 [Clostridiales bacterium]|jgi:hypothetical protein|nr:hypothetical protein [Clostridiales bacterium]
MKDYIPIKDFANQARVSPQAIYQRLDRDLKPYLMVVEGRKTLDIAALELFVDNTVDNSFKDSYYLYKHTSPSGKIYIGVTTIKPVNRWQEGHGYKYNIEFYNDILNYGWDSFNHEILGNGLSRTEAEAEEARLILEYESHKPEKGYNKQFNNTIKDSFNENKELVNTLQDTLKILTSQLEIKDKQITELNDRLKEAQELNRNNQILLGSEQNRTASALLITKPDVDENQESGKKKSFFQKLFKSN